MIVAVQKRRSDVAGSDFEIARAVDIGNECELSRMSPEFDAMWRDNDVRDTHGEAAKHIRHPVAGPIALEYSAFAVDGRPDLGMVIYNPASPADADRIRWLVKPKTCASKAAAKRARSSVNV